MKPFSKRFILIPVIVLSVLSVAFILFNVFSTKKTVAPTSTVGSGVAPASLEKLIPGKTTRGEVITLLGQPRQDIQGTSNETLVYGATSKTLSHQIIIEGGIVTMVKEMISYGDTEKVSDITKVYGLSTFSLYGQGSEGGSKLYVYPDKGIAYIGMPQFDTLEEIWHFVPTTVEDFKAKWAAGYSDTPVLNLY
jgi:hypothetical protein